jgi:hypothetical protein
VVCSRILIPLYNPYLAIELRKHVIDIYRRRIHIEPKRRSMDILEKLDALEPERRKRIINILLEHSKKLHMEPETEMLTQWLEEDP